MRSLLLLPLLAFCSLLLAPFAHGQSALGKTSLGKSQNSSEDLVNSLTPGKPNLTKGEKKEEVDPKKLPSKSMKDPMFQGTLMDVDIDWTGDKLGKPHTASDANSKASNQEDAAGAGPNKGQKATAAAADETPSEKENAKPDGDH